MEFDPEDKCLFCDKKALKYKQICGNQKCEDDEKLRGKIFDFPERIIESFVDHWLSVREDRAHAAKMKEKEDKEDEKRRHRAAYGPPWWECLFLLFVKCSFKLFIFFSKAITIAFGIFLFMWYFGKL